MIKFSAFAVAESGNKKTGLCSATYASQNSCPDDCALLNAGCYAQKGNTNIYTLQVNRFRDTALQVAKREAQAIDGLPADLDLRLHVVGDCKTIAAAKLVSTAVRRYLKRASRTIVAWTYTHAWREVPAKVWRGISILASCDTLQDIPLARAQGYATAFVARKGTGLYELFKRVPKTAVDAKYGKLIPCPYQVSPKKPQCVDCRLCFNTEFLKRTKSTIVFLEH